MNGQGNVDVMCNDKVLRLCVIRRKFRGRNKRDNTVKLNSILLVGLRDWEYRAEGKKPKVDLLYVYSDSQMNDLRKILDLIMIFCLIQLKRDDNIVFTNDIDDDEEFLSSSKQTKNIKEKASNNKDMDFDFDEI